ncbi:hypothetical protein V6Z11_A01G169800 [Gossypium hirsutum]
MRNCYLKQQNKNKIVDVLKATQKGFRLRISTHTVILAKKISLEKEEEKNMKTRKIGGLKVTTLLPIE